MELSQSAVGLRLGDRVAEIVVDYSEAHIRAYEHVVPRRPNFHDSPEAARRLGFAQTFASGTMITGHIIENLFPSVFGQGWSHAGSLNCANIRPILANSQVTLAADVVALLPRGDDTLVVMSVTARLPGGEDLISCTASALASGR